MSRRIVIIPTFAEAPMIACQIPNLMATVKPDVVIYNEGLFPNGPESTSIINDEFRKNYCYKDTNAGFDYEETVALIDKAKKDYPDTEWHYGVVDYPDGLKAEDCYTYAVSNFDDHGVTIEEGDILLPSEADVFHLETDVDKIDAIFAGMDLNDGVSTKWWEFGPTQFYIEQRQHPDINTVTKSRRFAVKYKDMDYYHAVVHNFVTQKYKNTRMVDGLITYHYPWFRTGKYRMLRYAILNRDPWYWTQFEEGLQKMEHCSRTGNFKESVMIRPNHSNNYKYMKYIDVEHPEAIKSHVNFVKSE